MAVSSCFSVCHHGNIPIKSMIHPRPPPTPNKIGNISFLSRYPGEAWQETRAYTAAQWRVLRLKKILHFISAANQVDLPHMLGPENRYIWASECATQSFMNKCRDDANKHTSRSRIHRGNSARRSRHLPHLSWRAWRTGRLVGTCGHSATCWQHLLSPLSCSLLTDLRGNQDPLEYIPY